MVLFRSDQKMKATEKIFCDSSQGKRGSHPVQGHVGKCQGQLRGEEAREKHGQKPLFWFSKDDVWRLPKWLSGKEAACQCRRCKRHGFDPWIGKIPWRRKWQLTPVWIIPWTEEPGGLQSIGQQWVGHDWAGMHTHMQKQRRGKDFPVNPVVKTLHCKCRGWGLNPWLGN